MTSSPPIKYPLPQSSRERRLSWSAAACRRLLGQMVLCTPYARARARTAHVAEESSETKYSHRYLCIQGSWFLCDSARRSIDTATAQCMQTPPQIDFSFHAKYPRTNPATTEAAASGAGLLKCNIM